MTRETRLIGCGDIHMSSSKLQFIPYAAQADAIVITGDMTNFGSTPEAKLLLDEFRIVNPTIFAQIGNLDKFDINDHLEQLNINLHGHSRLIQNTVWLIGIGGSNKTPFNTPTEFSEEELYETTRRAYDQALETAENIPVILVSHTPPHHTNVDKLANGAHVGSTAIRKIIEEYQPELCITGHIHEAVGCDKIRNTPIINPGMLCNGGWINILIKDSHITATLETIE